MKSRRGVRSDRRGRNERREVPRRKTRGSMGPRRGSILFYTMAKTSKKLEEVLGKLGQAGYRIGDISRLPNDYGYQVKIENGAVVNVFDSGKVVVQGKPGNKAAVEEALGTSGDHKAPTAQLRTNVFVVYGHDEGAKVELEAILRRWGVEPLLLDQLPSEGQTIIEKLEKYQSEADFGIVLATPDDEGHRAGQPRRKGIPSPAERRAGARHASAGTRTNEGRNPHQERAEHGAAVRRTGPDLPPIHRCRQRHQSCAGERDGQAEPQDRYLEDLAPCNDPQQ